MAHRTIGITQDEATLQVVVVEQSFRKFEITGAYVLNLQDNEENNVKILDLLKDTGIVISPSDTIITSYPGEKVLYDVMEFPFSDPRRLNAVLPFQVSGKVPFEVEDLLVDYQVIEKVGKGVKIIACATEIEEMRSYINKLKENKIDPEIVVPGGLELAVAGQLLGAQSSVVVLQHNHRLEMAYVDNYVLKRVRTVLTKTDQFAEVIRELTVFIAALGDEDIDVKQIYFLGGEESWAQDVEKTLGIGATVVNPTDLDLPFNTVVEEIDPVVFQALLLALIPEVMSTKGLANFRKGEFASAARFSILREKLWLIAVTLIVLITMLGIKGYLHYRLLSNERDALIKQVQVVSKELLGKAYSDPDKVLAKMKRQLSYNLDILPRCPVPKVLGTMFDLIESSGLASQEVVSISSDQAQPYAMEIESLRLNESQGYARCQADTIETMEKFIEGLKKSDCIQDVVNESTERINFRRHEGWQRFSVRFKVVQKEKTKKHGKKK